LTDIATDPEPEEEEAQEIPVEELPDDVPDGKVEE